MKVNFLYRFNGQDSTAVAGYIRELKSRYPMAVTAELDLNTRDGAAIASLYDAMNYPAILVTRNDGQLAQLWQGQPLPLVDEVISFAMM